MHISVREDTHGFLAEMADHYARPQNRQVVLILEGVVHCQRALDPRRRDALDHLLRHPDELLLRLERVLSDSP